MDDSYWGYGPDPIFPGEFVVMQVNGTMLTMGEMADRFPTVIFFVAELVPA
jgi:hypothetical protein